MRLGERICAGFRVRARELSGDVGACQANWHLRAAACFGSVRSGYVIVGNISGMETAMSDMGNLRFFVFTTVAVCEAMTVALAQQSWMPLDRTKPVAAYANGTRLESDALMIREAGRTLLPMRSLFQALGARVEWNQEERAVTAWTGKGVGMRFVVGKDKAQRLSRSDDAAVSREWRLDTPAMLIDGKVYVPVRAATEGLQAHVRWVEKEPAIYLTHGPQIGTTFGPADEPGVEGSPARSNPTPSTTRPSTPAPTATRTATGDAKTAIDLDGRPVRLAMEVGKDRFRRGETVTFQLSLTNAGDDRLVLRFRNGQQYDFEVRQGNTVVWNWSRGRLFAQALTTQALGPNEDVIFNADWTQNSNAGRQVTPGVYTVRGYITANAGRQLMVEKQIRIDR